MSYKVNSYAQAVLCVAGAFASTQACATSIVGGTTTFTADSGIESVYNALNVTATLIPPASGDLQADPQTLILPIVGGDTSTEADHAGGAILQAEGLTVDVTDIVIHFSGADAGTVTADLSFLGATENLAVADIVGTNSLIVDPQFAAQIQPLVGRDLGGVPLATFDFEPTTADAAVPEPAPVGLVTIGLLAVGASTARVKRAIKN